MLTTQSDTHYQLYQQIYQQAYQEVAEREQQKHQAYQTKDWHFLWANLQHFCPEVPPSQYESIYLRLMTNHQLSAQSLKYVELGAVERIQVRGNADFMLPQAKHKPYIFCTYHLGGYRGVMGLLLNAGYALTLVIDNRTLTGQQAFIQSVAAGIRESNPQAGDVEIIDAESPVIGRQMAGALAKGRSILIFIDGNSGVGGVYERNNRQLRLPFLNGTIYSRTGIAMLAYATRTPIQPIISYYETVAGCQVPRYYGLPMIHPQPEVPKDVFVRQATQQIYDYLATYLNQYIDQWESWFYWHKFLDTDTLTAPLPNADRPLPNPARQPLRLNTDRFGLFKVSEQAYAFDRQLYRAYPLTDKAFCWLEEYYATPGQPIRHLPDSSIPLEAYWAMGLLVPVLTK